jgi:hypothetical protein
MLFASVAWVFALTQAVRTEQSKLFWALLPFAFAEPVYVIYKLYQVIEHSDDESSAEVNPLLSIIPHVTFTVPYYGALAAGAMAVRVALLSIAWQCKLNFSKVCCLCQCVFSAACAPFFCAPLCTRCSILCRS